MVGFALLGKLEKYCLSTWLVELSFMRKRLYESCPRIFKVVFGEWLTLK